MKTKAFTILETVLAAILAMLLMAGSVGVIQNMQRETNRFKAQVDNDTTWMSANTHLAKTVRASSYLEIPNQNTLILHNYDATEKGRYVYNANQRRLEYYVNDGATLQETFNNVNAAFSPPSAGPTGKGWKENKLIEVVINYAEPFANTLYLRCAVGVNPESAWAIVIGGPTGSGALNIAQTSDNGWIISGFADQPNPMGSNVYVIKLNSTASGLYRKWSKVFVISGSWTGSANDVVETFDGNGVSNGYILACAGIILKGGIPTQVMGLIRLDTEGNVRWQRYFDISPIKLIFMGGVCIRQTFDRRTGGSPTGYIVSGGTDASLNPPGGMLLWKILESADLTSASCEWVSGFNSTLPVGWLHWGYSLCVKQLFKSDGTGDGYLISGIVVPSPTKAATIIKTTDSGAPEWSVSSGYDVYYADRHYSSSGSTDGYIVAGRGGGMNAFVQKLRDDRSQDWRWDRPGSYDPSLMNFYLSSFFDYYEFTIFGAYGLSRLSARLNNAGNYLGDNPAVFNYELTPGPFLWPRIIETRNASGLFDGYMLMGQRYVDVAGLGNRNIYVLKTDTNGNCVDAANPLLIPDTNDRITISWTSFSGAPAITWYNVEDF